MHAAAREQQLGSGCCGCAGVAVAGRISFRSIKKNRDYMQHRMHCSWHYLAHLAAVREFAYLKALHSHGFPVPEPVDMNRHAVLMEYIDAIPLTQVLLASPRCNK